MLTRQRPLPRETVHLPFDRGPYRMSMDLTTVPERDWFEIDEHYAAEIAERRQLLADAHDDVFGAVPGSTAARAEALNVVVTALAKHHPDWFTRDRGTLRNHLTGEVWNLKYPPVDPLELAGRLLQDDLCIIQEGPVPPPEAGEADHEAGATAPLFTAAVLCFPSRWRLSEKLGKPLAGVHGSVPLYAKRLERPVDRFMHHLKPSRIACRLNWSIVDNPTLFQPAGKWRAEGGAGITPDNAGEHLYLRVERQTLRRLPSSGAVLFGIRVHVYQSARIIDARLAPGLADAIAALPPESVHYKSVGPIRAPLLGWLAARAGTADAAD